MIWKSDGDSTLSLEPCEMFMQHPHSILSSMFLRLFNQCNLYRSTIKHTPECLPGLDVWNRFNPFRNRQCGFHKKKEMRGCEILSISSPVLFLAGGKVEERQERKCTAVKTSRTNTTSCSIASESLLVISRESAAFPSTAVAFSLICSFSRVDVLFLRHSFLFLFLLK